MPKRTRKIHYRAYGMTDKGKVRPNNEDAFVVNKDLGFFVVADGMGGMEKGEVASQLATTVSEKNVADIFLEPRDEETLTEDPVPPSHEAAMKRVVEKANRAIFKQNLGIDKKMGTTFVCAKFLAGKIYIANSGDSRCYHISHGVMHRLTEDHSPVEEMIQSGRATGKEPELKKMMRYVRGALGLDPDVEPDILTSIPKKGDVYLLCTDGLTKMLDEEKILTIINSEPDVKTACQRLVDLVNEAGGRDNVTVVMVKVTSVESSFPKKESLNLAKPVGEEEDTFEE